MERIAETDFFKRVNKAAQFFILLFIAECTVGSSGRWLCIGPLSIRILLFIIAFVISAPVVIFKLKEVFSNFSVISTVCFGLYFVLSLALGIKNGNRPDFIASDVTTFMSLALFPAFIAVMCNKKAINRAVNIVFYASCALSVAVLLLHVIMSFADKVFITSINSFLNQYSLGGFATLSTGIQRIYMRSQIFLQVAIIYGIWLLGKAKGKLKLLVLALEGCLFCAVIISYTRGFWFGLAIAAAMLLFVSFKYWKRYLKTAICMLLAFTVFAVSSGLLYGGPFVAVEVVNRFNPNLIVISGIDGDTADIEDSLDNDDSSVSDEDIAAANVRQKSLVALKEEISKKRVLGHGLGKNLDGIRNDGRTEYMYLDIILKMGIVGFALFTVVFFGFVAVQIYGYFKSNKLRSLPYDWDSPTVRNLFLTVGYLSVAVTSFFNPFLNNPMGIMLLMLTATAVYQEQRAEV